MIYIENGIEENSDKAQRYEWHLQQLYKSGLLDCTYTDNIVRWYISKELFEFNKQILLEYDISLDNYLIPLFIEEKTKKKEIKHEYPQSNILTAIIKNGSDIEKQFVRDTISTDRKLQNIEQHYDQVTPQELIQLCVRTLAHLTKLYLAVCNLKSYSKKDSDILKFWKTSWYSPPSLIELVNQLNEGEFNDITKANFILGLYRESFDVLTSFINDEFERNYVIRFDLADLTSEDSKRFHKIREDYARGNWFLAAQGTVEHVEQKLRVTLFNIFSILYGSFERRVVRIDDEIKDRMFKNQTKDYKKKFSRANNELQYLDRKDYSKVLTGPTQKGHLNWLEIFKYVFNKWTEDQLCNYLNSFGDFNTESSHLKTEVITSEEQNRLLILIVDSLYFVKALNRSYRIMLLNSLYK